MLTFKDAYKLALAKNFQFEIPTDYDRITFQGIISNEWELRIFWKLKVSDIDNSELPIGLIQLLQESIDANSIEEFKNEFNQLINQLNDLELDETIFNYEDEDYNEDYDWEEEEEEEEDNEEFEAIINFIRWR